MLETRASKRKQVNNAVNLKQQEDGSFTAPPPKSKRARPGLRLSNSVEPNARNPLTKTQNGGNKRVSRKINDTEATHSIAEQHTEETTLAPKRSDRNSVEPNARNPLTKTQNGGNKRVSRKKNDTEATHSIAEQHTEETTLAPKRSDRNSVEPNSRNPLTKTQNGGNKRVSRKINDTEATHSIAEQHTEETTLAPKRSETNSLLHQYRQLVKDRSGALKKSTIQPSEPAPFHETQQEEQVSNFIAGDENFQLVTEEDGRTEGSSFAQVQEIPGPKGSEDMDLSEKSDEDTSSRGDNNVVSNHLNDGLGENLSSCFPGRSLLQKTTSLNITEFAEQMDIDGLDDEVDSFGSNTNLVSVGGYRVKPEYATLLDHILSKFGDIASNSFLTTVAYRSFSMELLCEIIQKLMATSFIGIREADLEMIMGHVGDFEKANIDIEWLKLRLNEICEAKKAVQFLREHRQGKSELQQMNDQFEFYARAVAIKRGELEDLEKKMYAAKCNISVAEEKYKKMENLREESKAKLGHIIRLGSLLKGLIEI